MSVSTTHRLPRQDSSTSTCRASCVAHLGRNPKEHANMSASKTGSSTIFTAACTTRSATEGIESGLCSDEPGLGMNTRRAGSGRQRPPFNAAVTSSRSRETPYSWTSVMVIRSIPAAPPLRRTFSHARSRTSLRRILVPQRVESSPGIGLGPVQRMLQGTDRIQFGFLRGGTKYYSRVYFDVVGVSSQVSGGLGRSCVDG